MDAFIRCPKCNTVLRVPRNALGHRARCTACNAVFVLPREDDQLIDDTISAWIEHDVDEELTKRDQHVQEQLQPLVERSARKQAELKKKKAAASAADKPATHAPSGEEILRQAGSAVDDDDQPPTKHRRIPLIQTQPDFLSESMFAGQTLDGMGDASVTADATNDHHATADTAAARPVPMPDQATTYPTDLMPQGPRPYLVVERVSPTGVHMAFDHSWLMHHGFRHSMPVCCVFCGDAARSHLIARPLLFLDRSPSRKASYEQIIASHEHREIGDQHPRELARMMGIIEQMPDPFSFPMPYYVSTRYAHLTLHCETRESRDGRITCTTVIPDARTAMAWLGRVNGVWGPEYELLESEVAMLHGDAWKALDEHCRQRIAVWCKLRPREVVQGYFPDADFGKRDAGLAGIVVTDTRLVFNKYHHRGQVRLDAEDTEVHARLDAHFAQLVLISGSHRTRMVKLHQQDFIKFNDMLKNNQALKLHIHGINR